MSGELNEHEAVMSGHGFYNRHSVLQAAAAELGMAALRSAAAVVPISAPPQPLIVADYGCSQGQNSLRPMGESIAALRARTGDPITVVHTDLPGNDFSALFESLAHDPASYLLTDGNAYALATGRSFYEEVLPPASVALGWSATTTHWLSAIPGPVPGHLNVQLSEDETVRAKFANQAASDWRGFLAARAAELDVGGRLVMVEPCSHPDGTIGSENVMRLMDDVLDELVADGRLDVDTAADTTIPAWLRTPAEYQEPIDDHPGLALVSGRVVEGFPSPLWTQFEGSGDVGTFVRAAVGSMRGWSEAMLAATIVDARDLDWFYARCGELGTADPERLHIKVFHIVLDIQRR
ncbi:MAG: SAM-dependent methyltransferase [Actinobacteria bacterium]|nr:SAM-dependent methyltransferase [Actinomycetota bacterium]